MYILFIMYYGDDAEEGDEWYEWLDGKQKYSLDGLEHLRKRLHTRRLDDSPYFEESPQVEDLSEGHGSEH